MKMIHTLLFAFAMLAGGCGIPGKPVTLYDLGILPAATAPGPSSVPPLLIGEVTAPVWLDSPQMIYRLAYVNDQQPRSYAESRWSMSPPHLFAQRIKAHIVRAGGDVLPASAGLLDIPLLRIEIDDFTQIFDGPQRSYSHVVARVAVQHGRELLGQKTFSRQIPAPSNDAAGGARAIAAASDAVITDIMQWLSGLTLAK